MPRNGSGTYQLPVGNPVVTGTTISSSGWANPTLADIASALTASIAVDGQTVPTANLPMGNFRHVNVSSGQATNEYASVGQIQNAGFMLLGAGTGTISTSQSITSTGGNITSGSPTLNNQPQVRLQNSNRLMYFFQNTEGTVFGLFDGTSSNIRWQTDPASNFTVTGNITASSDERLKKDWDSLPDDFVERLANVLHGSFTRIDTGARQVGVGARSLRELLPEAVSGDDVLSVAYGNAALVSAIQLAIELLKLRDRVAALEGA